MPDDLEELRQRYRDAIEAAGVPEMSRRRLTKEVACAIGAIEDGQPATALLMLKEALRHFGAPDVLSDAERQRIMIERDESESL